MDLNAILNKAIQNLQEDDDMMDAGVNAALAATQKNPNYYSTTAIDPEVVDRVNKGLVTGIKTTTEAPIKAAEALGQTASSAGQAVVDAGAGGAKALSGEHPAPVTPTQKAMLQIGQVQDWAKANPALAAGVPAALLAGAGALALRRRQLAARGK